MSYINSDPLHPFQPSQVYEATLLKHHNRFPSTLHQEKKYQINTLLSELRVLQFCWWNCARWVCQILNFCTFSNCSQAYTKRRQCGWHDLTITSALTEISSSVWGQGVERDVLFFKVKKNMLQWWLYSRGKEWSPLFVPTAVHRTLNPVWALSTNF